MKQCPKCNRTYDDSQFFCLMDGTALKEESEEQTTIVQSSPPKKKSRFLLWTGLAVLAILAGGAAVGGFLIYKFSNRTESVSGKRQSNAATSPSPMPSSTPKTTPTPTNSSPVEERSPKIEETKPTPNNEDSEDITPINWETTASGFKGGDGQTYKFRCPEQGTEHIVWGSDIYTLDSSICTAAVHAGLFSLDSGGVVTIEFRPGRLTYGSTVRNGITSKTYGEYPNSFVVR